MARLRFRAKQSPSRLEERFLFLWHLAKGPPLEREFRFHDQRRWRSDFAHLPSRTLIEIEGGIWVQGRHNRAAGFNADLEKYLEAGLLGWRVFRLGPEQITMENVEKLVRVVTAPTSAANKILAKGSGELCSLAAEAPSNHAPAPPIHDSSVSCGNCHHSSLLVIRTSS